MSSHAPDLPEWTSPLFWTIGLVAIVVTLVLWFSHWFGAGRVHGRELVIPVEKPTQAPVDHAKLIADRSEAVLDKGQIIFSKTCAACHGPTGAENPTGLTPPPRNFHKDAFQNPNGGGPYGLYTVLENGFNGRMPAQAGLTAEEKYAVIHFVRETIVKKDNPAAYVDKDKPEVLAKMPKPGDAVDGPVIPPAQRPVKVPVQPLIAAIASDNDADARAADIWIQAVAGDHATRQPPAEFARVLGRLADRRGSGAMVTLYRAAKARDNAAIWSLLSRGDSPFYQPAIVGMAETRRTALTSYLADQVASSSSARPATATKGAK